VELIRQLQRASFFLSLSTFSFSSSRKKKTGKFDLRYTAVREKKVTIGNTRPRRRRFQTKKK
jgi:hypothetical protein